ncbi:hypothetical protein L211DRAFT_843615 [Terfezia boudieri ATCC MYA-4762]|uniref:Uncharacterized protein n=1 Tax=Terfezia boudieri ATCC MYA-4762 TaxID=1051890 RepID=A0A3N4L6F9_9PEZI|nr:hypothetical protein L211DRAFT_843615 [Terfezia boudieri ATCC MYA-4762]
MTCYEGNPLTQTNSANDVARLGFTYENIVMGEAAQITGSRPSSPSSSKTPPPPACSPYSE